MSNSLKIRINAAACVTAVAALLAGVALGSTWTVQAQQSQPEPQPAATEHVVDMRHLPIDKVALAIATPCATEDSHNCYWDAGLNGIGHSYIDILGNLFPLPQKEAS